MKQSNRASTFLQRIHTLPLSWLNLSLGKRLLIVILSYWLGMAGLWFFFPRVHNGASMFLPIVSACWLFRYRGMLISIVLNGLAFQLAYLFLWQGMLPNQAFVEECLQVRTSTDGDQHRDLATYPFFSSVSQRARCRSRYST